jgi:type II secretory pathway pseudopilin PulG
MRRKSKGFSLVEILVSLTLIMILSSMMLIIFNNGSKMFSRDRSNSSQIKQLETAASTGNAGLGMSETSDYDYISFSFYGKEYSKEICIKTYSYGDSSFNLKTFY